MSQKRPNIILITTDQQRFDGLGLNRPDSPLQTPTLDQLAINGVNFTRGYTTCPVCIPARRSLLTGLHPVTHGLRGYKDGLDWEPPFTLPGILSDNGYQTELIGKLHLFPQRKRYGFDHMIRTESPNDRYDTDVQPVNDWATALKKAGVTQHPNNIGINGNGRLARPWDMEERWHHTSWLSDRAVDFLVDERDPTCPFFLHLSYWAPHPPLTPPQTYWDRYYRRHNYEPHLSQWTPHFDEVPRGISDVSATGPFTLESMQDAASGYFGLINHIDDRIRFVLERAFGYGSARAKEPTLIIFTSDHGEMLGDHHLWRKSLPYEGSAHVPYFMAWRNMDLQPGTCDELVCLEDIVATALDICGCDMPAPLGNGLDGTSLAPILRGEQTQVRERLFGECTGFSNHFIVEGAYKYIWYAKTGEEQLFNLEEDPQEDCDLSADTSRLEPYRQQLERHLRDREDYTFDRSKLTPCCNKPPHIFWAGKC